jgi:hypothetical protein
VAALPGAGDGLPRDTPALAGPVSAVCAAAGVLTLDPDLTAAGRAVPVGGADPAGAALADRIVVPPGHGALVAAVASPSAPDGALCLVTDLGRRYPLPGPEVAALLGYRDAAPVRVPAELVALLPAGPVLDPAAAHQPA